MNATEITIQNFLTENLNRFSPIKLKVIQVTNASNACNDSNEELYLALVEPEDSNDLYTNHEPCINTRKLSEAIQELDIANEDGVLTIENYIGLNASMLIPITILA